MKQQADKHRYDKSVWSGLLDVFEATTMPQSSVAVRKSPKLSSNYYRPYQVMKKIENAAYELQLPSNTKIHPIFHVSQLRRKIGANVIPVINPPIRTTEGIPMVEPIAV